MGVRSEPNRPPMVRVGLEEAQSSMIRVNLEEA